MEKSNYWGYFCNRWISILSHLLYFKVCISNLTTNSKLSCCARVFWCYFSNVHTTISDKIKSWLYRRQQPRLFCIKFYLSILSFFFSKPNTNDWRFFYMWSLCPASPGFWNCNFPVTLPQSALKLAHKNKASMEPAQVKGAGNSFCVPLGYYLLGRNAKLTLNDKAFVVFIFLFCLLFTFVSQLYPSSGVQGVFTVSMRC